MTSVNTGLNAFAMIGAAYARAAARVGKYEEVADLLFLRQTEWAASGKVDEVACRVLTPAEVKTVRSLVNDPSISAEIQRDLALGQKLAVQRTPTMLIRHGATVYPWSGAVNYELLRSYLDSELAK